MAACDSPSWVVREKDRQRRLRKITEQAVRNRAIADTIKLSSGCVDCGYNANALALQFDHRDGVKKKDVVSQLVKRSTPIMLAEIAKCDVRCANCHLIRTKERGHHLRGHRRNSSLTAVEVRKLFSDVVLP